MTETTPYQAEMNNYIETLLTAIGHDESKLKVFRRWRNDLRAAIVLGDRQARYFVDSFYAAQDNRKRHSNQIRDLKKADEPFDFIEGLLLQDSEQLEAMIGAVLGDFVDQHKVGPWLQGVYGVGPIIAAGLLAHIDIYKAPTVGHIWQHAGIAGDGQREWLQHTKRPFNAFLKTLCYKIGDVFIKFSNRPECVYGHIYRRRKNYEVTNNDAGKLVEQAAREAAKKAGARAKRRAADKETPSDVDRASRAAWEWNAGCYPAGTCAEALKLETKAERENKRKKGKPVDEDQPDRETYLKSVCGEPLSGQPMLHLGHINDRARRYAVKQFLADLHGEWYRREFDKEPPLPYPIAILGHAHMRSAAE